MTAGTVSPDEMLPKRMPLPGGSGWRMSPVRTPVWSPCPFTTTPRAMVRCGSTRAGATAAGAVGAEPGAGGELGRLLPHGELHDEPAAARQVVARPDEAVVVGDDSRHDGEPEARAVGLGGEVGLEEPGLHLGRHALAVVGDLEPHDAELRHVGGLELDAAALAGRDLP